MTSQAHPDRAVGTSQMDQQAPSTMRAASTATKLVQHKDSREGQVGILDRSLTVEANKDTRCKATDDYVQFATGAAAGHLSADADQCTAIQLANHIASNAVEESEEQPGLEQLKEES